MFNHSYFSKRHFNERYFPPVEVVVIPIPTPNVGGSNGVIKPLVVVHNISIMLSASAGFTNKLILKHSSAPLIKVDANAKESFVDPNAGKRKAQQIAIIKLFENNSIDI